MTAQQVGEESLTRFPGDRVAVVRRVRFVSDSVKELTLADASGVILPEWQPGSHIDVILPSGTVRQYSLCGRSSDRLTYTVAVLREPVGRGGSAEVHDSVDVGTRVGIRGPRNHFALAPAKRYLFVAGGIGITPLLPMIREAAGAGADWDLLYGGRTLPGMAYLDEIATIRAGSAATSPSVTIVPEDEAGRPDLLGALSSAAAGTQVYACGPEPLLQALEQLATVHLPPGSLHLERFGAKAHTEVEEETNEAFEVEIASTGEVLAVSPDQRLIDVVRQVVPQVPFSCEEGYCGSCETGVLAGTPCHRDQVLTDEERAANDTMMICVGRALSDRLTLDL